MKNIFIPLFLLLFTIVQAQDSTLTRFAAWKQKEGMDQDFENGYKKHLQWHKANGDTWNWYGWYFTSGPRAGQFLDATDNHHWSDFDKATRPAEDWADNLLHVVPFADFQTVFTVKKLGRLSAAEPECLKSKYIRYVTIQVKDILSGIRALEKLKEQYIRLYDCRSYVFYKVIDGGDLNQLLILLGYDSYEKYGKSDRLLEDLAVIETNMKIRIIDSITSETMTFIQDMSLIPK